MAEYRAKPGQEDRHGEMTGAITFNMIFCTPVVTAWGIFIGPWLLESVWAIATIAVIISLVMPIICMPLSRVIWAHVSEYMDTH
jgi:hypothetical protein